MMLNKTTALFKLRIIFFTSFLDFLSFAAVIPIIPLLFLDPHHSIFCKEFSLEFRYLLLGALYATYPLAQILATPMLGAFADQLSKKAILLISYGGNATGYLLFGLGILHHQLLLLFVGYFIAGMTGGNISTSNSLISDLSEREKKTGRFSLLSMVMGLAFILGPSLTGQTIAEIRARGFDYHHYLFIASSLSLFNLMFVLTFLDSSFRCEKSKIPSIKGLLKDVRSVIHNEKKLTRTLLSIFLLFMGWYFFIKFFQVYLICGLDVPELQIFNVLSYFGFCCVVTQFAFFFISSKTEMNRTTLYFFITLLALSIFALAFVKSFLLLIMMVTLFSISYSILHPSLVFVISEFGSIESQGKVMGLYQSVQALAKVIAPLLAGAAMNVWVKSPLLISCLFILSSALLLNLEKQKVSIPE